MTIAAKTRTKSMTHREHIPVGTQECITKMSISNEPTFKRLRLMDKINEPSAYCSSAFLDDKRDDQQSADLQIEEQRNSLMRLNDYCLRDIFARLDTDTLCRLADVSTRLRSIAEKAFAKKYTEKCHWRLYKSKALFRRFLCKFGQLITSICSMNDYCSEEQINGIIKHCPNLEILEIKLIGDLKIMPNSLSKLITLKLNGLLLTIDTFRKLISLSPQLKQLEIGLHASDDHIAAIIQYTKNLEQLKIKHVSEQLTKEGLLQLIELKKLKRFHYSMLQYYKIDFIASLMTAFSKANVHLNYLHLKGKSINFNDIKSILNLKELEYLHLEYIECDSHDLVSLVRDLPLLSTIELEFAFKSLFPVIDLVNMVKVGKQLHKIEFYQKYFEINQKTFEELVEAASNRLNQETLIIGLNNLAFNTKIDVPDDVQYTNRHQLQITFKNSVFGNSPEF